MCTYVGLLLQHSKFVGGADQRVWETVPSGVQGQSLWEQRESASKPVFWPPSLPSYLVNSRDNGQTEACAVPIAILLFIR